MKPMGTSSVAIYFMTYFYRTRGMTPLPHRSATALSYYTIISVLHAISVVVM